MEAHADTETSRDPPEQNGHGKSAPTKHENSGERADMKYPHENYRIPIKTRALVKITGFVLHQDSELTI
jgi:hypothetical protein